MNVWAYAYALLSIFPSRIDWLNVTQMWFEMSVVL